MGYNTNLGSMPKREYNKIKSMTREQLIEHYKLEVKQDENYLGMGVYDFGDHLYCFGDNTDFVPPKKSVKTFFKNKQLNEYFNNEDELAVVTKEFLASIIETYNKRIADYYNEMMNPFFGVKNGVLEKDNPSNFLNSIKTDYGSLEKNSTFDFDKITQEEQNALFKIIEHIRSMRMEWTHLTPYDLENGVKITSSWKYEYAIFELVRIYKSFDWKRNVMIYYGY